MTTQHRIGDRQLLSLDGTELDRLFRTSPAGDLPTGDADGTVLLWSGTWLGLAAARVARAVGWQGKAFDADGRGLRNKITPFGVRAIRAQVYPGQSWVDGGDCIVLDYSKKSLVARWVRDEIRLVGPDHFLGVVWLRHRRVAAFSLRFARALDG